MAKQKPWDKMTADEWRDHQIDEAFLRMRDNEQLDVLTRFPDASSRRREVAEWIEMERTIATNMERTNELLKRRDARIRFTRDVTVGAMSGLVVLLFGALIAAGFFVSPTWFGILRSVLIGLVWIVALIFLLGTWGAIDRPNDMPVSRAWTRTGLAVLISAALTTIVVLVPL